MQRTRLTAAGLLAASLFVGGCASDAFAPKTKAYLEQARQAVEARNAPAAIDAIYRAENEWIGNNVPFTNVFFQFDPEALRDMARARQSGESGRWNDAEYYIDAALTHPSVVTPSG